ncbi:MAG: JAB domain-containing protein [Clostridia bacterium]
MSNQEVEKNKSAQKANLHAGHRERMLNKFLEKGIDVFDDHEVLEFLLFYGIHVKNTNEIAHELINAFGSLDKVFDAPTYKLQEVDGIGKRNAALIKLIPAIQSRVLAAKNDNIKIVKSAESAFELVLPRFLNLKVEKLVLLCLDNAYRVLCIQDISVGTATSVNSGVDRILEYALSYKSTFVIICHNHPCGTSMASHEDILLTGQLNAMLLRVNIHLFDHIVVANGGYCSLKECGMLGLK